MGRVENYSCRYNPDYSGWGSDIEYLKRLSKSGGDKLGMGFDVAWDADVVSINGAHYHFWVPRKLENNKDDLEDFLKKCKVAASWQGDPVSFSYSFVPTFKAIASHHFTNALGLVLYELPKGVMQDPSELILLGENDKLPEPKWTKIGPDGGIYTSFGEMLINLNEFVRI